MVKNNLVGHNIVYIGIKQEDVSKVTDVLNSAKVEYNGTYKDALDIFCHKEVSVLVDEFKEENPSIELTAEQENQLVESVYNELSDIQTSIYDTEYISSVKQKHMQKFMTRE